MNELSRRQQRFQDEWRRLEAGEFRELSREARELRHDLAARAGRRREARLRELEELLVDLESACGPQPGLRELLDRLKARAVDRYQEHEDWLEEFGETNEYFRSIAGDHSPVLQQRLNERTAGLMQNLRILLDKPLAEELRQRATVLESELDGLAGLDETEEVLWALRRSNELQNQLEDWETEARKSLEKLLSAQRGLHERNDWLQSEGSRWGFAGPDFSEAIAALGEGTAHRTLDRAQRLAEELEAAVAEREQGFLAHCREVLAKRSDVAAGLIEALEAAGAHGSAIGRSAPGSVSDPRQAARMLAAAEAAVGLLFDLQPLLAALQIGIVPAIPRI